MNTNAPLLTPPDLDDETVIKLNDFLYEILDAFETHYSYQILRHQRNFRTQRMSAFLKQHQEEDESDCDFEDDVDF
jgi:hypothetical protein